MKTSNSGMVSANAIAVNLRYEANNPPVGLSHICAAPLDGFMLCEIHTHGDAVAGGVRADCGSAKEGVGA